MNILVTGGCGFIGSSIAIFLKKKIKKSKILSIDNLSRNTSVINLKRLKNNGIINIKYDLKKKDCFSKINKKFDLVIDCCAEPAVELSKSDVNLVVNSNFISTLNILEKVKKDNAKIIFLSSSRVYSITSILNRFNNLNFKKKIKKRFLIDEKFSTSSPQSLYGLTKFASEKLIKEYSYLYNIDYIINRFGVISGPWQFGKQDQGFVSLWLWRHLIKKNLKYIGFGGHGHQIRDVLHIDDVCDLILEQIIKIKKIKNFTFNVGGSLKNSLSLLDLTLFCQKLTKNKIKIFRSKYTSKYDIPLYISNNKLVYSKYKWRVRKSLMKILKDTLNILIKNKNNLSRIL